MRHGARRRPATSPSTTTRRATPRPEVGGGLPLIMLHGGGPGASSWSNFGPALPGFAASFRTLLVDQPGFGQSDKPQVTANYFRFASEAVVQLHGRAGHREGPHPGQQPRWRDGDAARAVVPGARRSARAHGAGRTVAQPVPRRPDRGRPAVDGLRRRPVAGSTARLHLDDGGRPATGHRRAGRAAIRRRHRARRTRGDGVHGCVVLEPGLGRGRDALARGPSPTASGTADVGTRRPRQPAGRRLGCAQADPERPAARVPAQRALGTARGTDEFRDVTTTFLAPHREK